MLVAHNDVWDNGSPDYINVVSGTADISADPLFVDAAAGNYHLQAGSPCIDAGTPAGAPMYDIEGNLRGATPDMGAYERAAEFDIFLPLIIRSSG